VCKELPHEAGHFTGSLASNSPITDGERLFAFFGSRGLYCFDFDGKLQWQSSFGQMQTKHAHGEGSTPALHGDTVVVNWDHEGRSFVTALDKRTGRERWKVDRDEATSWASPIVVEHGGKPQVIISGTKRTRGYDLESGRVLWECGGLSSNIVASPVAADGMVFAGSSYEIQSMLAIRLEGASGEWGRDRHKANRLDANPRHTVRPVAAALRRCAVLPSTLPGNSLPRQRQDRRRRGWTDAAR
jgi:outer membrane protein assembly factor BamB